MPFNKSRPSWLKSESGTQLELDGYSETLRIAFEHQGRQHHSLVDKFEMKKEDLKHRVSLDERKKVLCKRNGVVLLEIFEIGSTTAIDQLGRVIGLQLEQFGVAVPSGLLEIKPDYSSCYKGIDADLLAKYAVIASSQGGALVSTIYLGSKEKLEFLCVEGHSFRALPGNVAKGRWCGDCRGNKTGTIEEMQEIARSRGGKCISKVYVNNREPLLWECSKRHRWNASASNVKTQKTWCRICAGKKPLSTKFK